MPNHVTNRLLIIGPESKVEELKQAIAGDPNEYPLIDFNKVMPMPESLHVTSGGMVMPIVERDLRIRDAHPLMASLQAESQARLKTSRDDLTPEEQAEYDVYVKNYQEYGHLSWYGWANEYWGTKWNAYDQIQVGDEIVFSTAWAMPHPIFVRISEMFPEVQLLVRYADEDLGSNLGEIVYENGTFTENMSTDSFGEDRKSAVKWACEIRGYDEESIQEIMAEMEEYLNEKAEAN